MPGGTNILTELKDPVGLVAATKTLANDGVMVKFETMSIVWIGVAILAAITIAGSLVATFYTTIR